MKQDEPNPGIPGRSSGGSTRHRESSREAEALALHAALPLRYIAQPGVDGSPAVLNCGHEAEVQSPVARGTCIRCVSCYMEQMRNAQRLLSR
jgi:hypothetical protein